MKNRTVFKLESDYIQLNQLLKLLGLVETGAESNAKISNGLVSVNGITEYRKRNKLYAGTVVNYNGETIEIISD